jgi:hypothetical protein
MAMVDASLILDVIVAVSIAAGAFFAIIELRDMKRDRRTQIMLQASMHWTTREFEDAMGRLWRADASDAKGLEKEVSYADLSMVVDFHWAMAQLGLQGLVDTKTLLRLFPFSGVWMRVKPWVIAYNAAEGHQNVYSSLEKFAQLQDTDGRFYET